MKSQGLETRYPCPVCLGATLQKTKLSSAGGTLVLDSCARCGGIWFELGEVQRLRAHPPEALLSTIREHSEPYRAACHNCHVIIDRNVERCPGCGAANEIDCPTCGRTLEAQTHDGLRLDVCKHCKGVWFDRVELASIWTMSVDATKRRMRDGSGLETGALVAADVLFYSPELVFYGARAAGMAVEGGAQMLMHAPGAVGALAEGAGAAAEGVFEAIMEIISGIFS